MTPETKICANPACGREFGRNPGEWPYKWRQRITCSRECGNVVGGRKGAVTRAVGDLGVSYAATMMTSAGMFAPHTVRV